MPCSNAINISRLNDLLRKMLDIYSPSGREDELTDFLFEFISANGLPVTRQLVDGTRANLLVGAPSGDHVPLAFIGHIDTVPAYDVDQYESVEEDGWISGLGAADMKGGCAAMIEAFIANAEAGTVPEAMLALVVGEEDSGDGTRRLLDEYSFKHVVVGEPTDLVPCNAHYGYLEMALQAFGKRRHASMAGQDNNAVVAMLRTIFRISSYVEREVEHLVFNIRDLQSSASGFAVPGQCTAHLDFHMPPLADPSVLAVTLGNVVKMESGIINPARVDCSFPTSDRGYVLSHDSALLQSVRAAMDSAGLPWCSGEFKSHSDANQLYSAGAEPLLFGPGQLARAHMPEESVMFDQVVKAARFYAAMLPGK